MQPNKSDALAYLNSGSVAPDRYARVVVRFGATLEPYIREYQVGPLPVSSAKLAFLDSIYNKGRGYQRFYNADPEALQAFVDGIGAQVADITKALLNAVSEARDALTMLIFLTRRS